LGADRGHDQGAATLPLDNSTDETERTSTGGGPPRVHVRRQHGQEDAQHRSESSDNMEALGMEPDDDWWEQLVHPPQLLCISQASRQGGLGGKLGT
jgi:hypothetical protein